MLSTTQTSHDDLLTSLHFVPLSLHLALTLNPSSFNLRDQPQGKLIK